MSDPSSQLHQAFRDLHSWRDDAMKQSCDRNFDTLALVCLDIVCQLIPVDGLDHLIAKELSLVFSKRECNDSEQELRDSFEIVEEDLEENLRGFSALLDFVLEEESVKRDPVKLLEQMDGVDEEVIDQFNSMIMMLEAYFDLDDAFAFECDRSVVVIFVTMMAALCDRLLGEKSGDQIEAWLRTRVSDDVLIDLFAVERDFPSVSQILAHDHKHMRELLIFLVCFKVARSECIKSHEVSMLDAALAAEGMFGVKPLLDSGFLTVEDRDDHSAIKGNVVQLH